MINFDQNEGDLSQEEMSANLDTAMAGVESSYRKFNSTQLMAKNKADADKKKVINNIFDTMESLGVDPSDQKELSTFLEKSKETHPEMVAIIEQSLNELLKEQGQTEQEPQPTEPLSPPVDPSTQPTPDMSQMLG